MHYRQRGMPVSHHRAVKKQPCMLMYLLLPSDINYVPLLRPQTMHTFWSPLTPFKHQSHANSLRQHTCWFNQLTMVSLCPRVDRQPLGCLRQAAGTPSTKIIHPRGPNTPYPDNRVTVSVPQSKLLVLFQSGPTTHSRPTPKIRDHLFRYNSSSGDRVSRGTSSASIASPSGSAGGPAGASPVGAGTLGAASSR